MKKMQKFVVLAVLAAVAATAFPAVVWSQDKPVNLGLDHVNMQLWIVDYGVRVDGTLFSVVRKYYTSEGIRQETIELLMSKFGCPPEVAGNLYFTEYWFEYTNDRSQFATAYLGHYMQRTQDNLIHETVFDDSSEDTKKTFAPIVPNHASGRALALIPR